MLCLIYAQGGGSVGGRRESHHTGLGLTFFILQPAPGRPPKPPRSGPVSTTPRSPLENRFGHPALGTPSASTPHGSRELGDQSGLPKTASIRGSHGKPSGKISSSATYKSQLQPLYLECPMGRPPRGTFERQWLKLAFPKTIGQCTGNRAHSGNVLSQAA